MRMARSYLLLLLLIPFFAAAAPEARAQCSPPYLVDQQFPTSGPMETRWRLCWQPVAGSGLVITAAYFQKSPGSPLIRLFWDARVAEIFVPYHSGSPRFLDVKQFGFSLFPLNLNDCPAARGGVLLGPNTEVCKEVHDRGLAWKDDNNVRRGEELVLWSTLDAGNYNYVIEWTFRDDGVVMGRVGATAQNLSIQPYDAHMHGPIWRLDIDFNGFAGDSAYLGTHKENLPLPTATDSMTLIATESGQQWDPLAFTSIHVQDSTLKNARGNASAYHLIPMRYGTPRHKEPYTKNDFWVTRYNPAEMFPDLLSSYISPPQNISSTDIVVWYYGGAHHLVRDEDGHIINDNGFPVWTGEAHIMWNGFMLMPHNLFDKTPLCPTSLCP